MTGSTGCPVWGTTTSVIELLKHTKQAWLILERYFLETPQIYLRSLIMGRIFSLSDLYPV